MGAKMQFTDAAVRRGTEEVAVLAMAEDAFAAGKKEAHRPLGRIDKKLREHRGQNNRRTV